MARQKSNVAGLLVLEIVEHDSMIFYPALTPAYSYPLGADYCQVVADLVALGAVYSDSEPLASPSPMISGAASWGS